jgi:phospholipid/cholesterol/gamma-HCH transport system substrate-binding protein
MEKSRLEMKVGLFVAVCLILLAVLVIQFSKGTSLFRGTYTLRLHAVNVGGLKVKSGVLLSGVQVGTVNEIQLAPDGRSVTIQLKVYKDFPIYHDARFVIETAGILGDQFVSVMPTSNAPPTLADGADVECQEPFDLQEVARSAAGFIQRLDGTAKKLDDAVTDLRSQVLNAQTLSSFGTSITNLRVFTEQAIGTIKGINDVIATNGSEVGVAVSNAVYFSAELTRFASSAQEMLATNGDNLTVATKNLEDISVTAKQLAADLQAGKGLAGTVLQNPELATNVQILAANLSITSSNLNRLGLWGILWSHKPAATKPTKP